MDKYFEYKTKVEPEEEVPATRPSDQEPPEKKVKWTNKTRTLVIAGMCFL